MYFLCLYLCCKSTKVQKYKKYKKNPGRIGPKVSKLLMLLLVEQVQIKAFNALQEQQRGSTS